MSISSRFRRAPRGRAKPGARNLAWLGAALVFGGIAATTTLVWEHLEPPESVARVLLSPRQRVALAEDATTRLDVERAAELLEGTTGPDAAQAKARLAIFRADCEGAMSHLSSRAAQERKGAMALLNLARRCHGATAEARVVEDKERGIWLRVQDEADLVLAPLLIDVAARSRAALTRDLGIDLPRPLRIDLVRDLFSLSAVSGLPVDAAETTGTVAVARWGRVTLVSPRAPRHGFSWADTMAHELTHLMLSRASADRAPLWLQEGIAKIQEQRWRAWRPFDGDPDAGRVAIEADREGRSVGITQIGPSIAMLPSADAASVAFAEVSSFMGYWIERNGRAALSILLHDLAVSPDADSAMRGVSGLSLSDWELLWREALARRYADAPLSADAEEPSWASRWEVGRALRVSELLHGAERDESAARVLSPLLDAAPHVAAMRFALTRSGEAAGWENLSELLGELEDVERPHGGWLVARGRLDSGAQGQGLHSQGLQSDEAAVLLGRFGVDLDPLSLDVACGATELDAADPHLRKLCDHVRQLPERHLR